jgi:hypothetical protein
MHWHSHAINEQREMTGLKPVNSIWLWGGATTATQAPSSKIEETFTLSGSNSLFGRLGSKQHPIHSATDILQAKPQHGLLVLDSLIESAMASDWAEWLSIYQRLETDWFVPLLNALKDGQLERLSLTVSHNTGFATYATSTSSLRKFWVKPSLARLSK